MKFIKTLMMVIALSIPFASFAMESDQQVEYTEALRDGNVKVVKKYLDCKLLQTRINWVLLSF